ncbi:MFS transporter, DHA3 family, tetracycline resistance protein [Cryptosporangium aurantiacum]|uniref:MFS transporter, DHA3 family, tetracycline resistance protein n=1 Tax=Cryptosporangium aurantiacum TaxID=134849 RepID=A0A1M7J8Y7_9ACTN|nr:MFS transporter, DHA3 family, tetracycline resistance protein [Cryptosporangium aurantiacum]
MFLGLRCTLAACTGLVYTTIVVYRVDAAGLDPLQLVLVGTALEAAYFAFQLPTGVLADLGHNRACVIAGVAVLGVGCVVEALLPLFLGILAAQVIGALGYALVSGALEAWIAGEVEGAGEGGTAGEVGAAGESGTAGDGGTAGAGGTAGLTRVYLRGSQAGLIGTLGGTAVSGLVAGVRTSLPLLVGGGVLIATAVVLTLVMPERARPRSAEAEAGAGAEPGAEAEPGAVDTVRAAWGLIRVRPAFLLVFAVVALVGGWSEAIDRLWGAHLLETYRLPGPDATTWFSVLGVAATLLGLVVTQLIATRAKDADTMGILLGVVAALLVTTVVFGLATNVYLAIGAALALAAARTAFAPVLTAWLVERTDPSVRATVLSTRDMFDATGQVVGGPALGAIGTYWSLRAALVVSAAALAPAAALLLAARRRLRRSGPRSLPAAAPRPAAQPLPAAPPGAAARPGAETRNPAAPEGAAGPETRRCRVRR